jgi:hypothetical protein
MFPLHTLYEPVQLPAESIQAFVQAPIQLLIAHLFVLVAYPASRIRFT